MVYMFRFFFKIVIRELQIYQKGFTFDIDGSSTGKYALEWNTKDAVRAWQGAGFTYCSRITIKVSGGEIEEWGKMA